MELGKRVVHQRCYVFGVQYRIYLLYLQQPQRIALYAEAAVGCSPTGPYRPVHSRAQACTGLYTGYTGSEPV